MDGPIKGLLTRPEDIGRPVASNDATLSTPSLTLRLGNEDGAQLAQALNNMAGALGRQAARSSWQQRGLGDPIVIAAACAVALLLYYLLLLSPIP